MYWNYFDKKRDIQIGWAYDMDRRTSGSIQRMAARQQHIMMYFQFMELQRLNETVESTEYYIG